MRLGNGRFLKITELYAFISVDDCGHEAIIGFKGPDGVFLPMIGADIENVDKFIPVADKIQEMTGVRYEIRYFSINQQK